MYPRPQNDHEILTQFLFSGVYGIKWKGWKVECRAGRAESGGRGGAVVGHTGVGIILGAFACH